MPTIAGMKVSAWSVGAVLAVMLPSWSWARLGETPEQCEERYGAPIVSKVLPMDSIAPGGVVTLYRKSGLEIKVLYFSGTAWEVRFEKSEKDALGFAEEFSPTEIESLMEANSSGKEWQGGYPSCGGIMRQRDYPPPRPRHPLLAGPMYLIDRSEYAMYEKKENSLQFIKAEIILKPNRQLLDGF